MNSIERREARHRGRCRFLSLVATIFLVGLLVASAAAIGGAAYLLTDAPSQSQSQSQMKAEGEERLRQLLKNHDTSGEGAEPSTTGTGGDGSVQTFSGNGGKSLGTIKVPAESILRWSNDGDIFQIFSDEAVPVNSQSHSGDTVLSPGAYGNFQVNAIGNWTITIKAK